MAEIDDSPQPSVIDRREQPFSRWFTVVEKDVSLPWVPQVETYHALRSLPYVATLAITVDKQVPLIRQWRPALETYTWELPAGLIEEGEEPEDTCRRELAEETGLLAQRINLLGKLAIDPGRVDGYQFCFLAYCGLAPVGFAPEPGTTVEYVAAHQLAAWVSNGRLANLSHLAVLYLTELHGHRLNLGVQS